MHNANYGSRIKIVSRIVNPPEESYFPFGPRGTGKSTWLLQRYPKATRIDLLLREEERLFSSYPEKICDVAAALPEGSTLIIRKNDRGI